MIICLNFSLPLQYVLTLLQREEEDREEEVKLISSMINLANDFDDDILSEFESLLSEQIEFPLLVDKTKEAMKDGDKDTEMEKKGSELERLQNVVKELEEREADLESVLLEYYGLKEQVVDTEELQRQLRIKTVEIDMLRMTVKSLQEENDKLQKAVAQKASANRELEASRNKIKELQTQIRVAASQTKGQLLLLKQKVSGLQTKEEEVAKKDAEIEKKLKNANELEIEIVELKRRNKELQHEKRELTVSLNTAESRIAEHSSLTKVRVL